MTDSGLKRILILDDDPEFRQLLITRMSKPFEGVELEEYDPVARGIPDESFDWSRYDVLLLDYYLCIQGVTGLDILQANRRNPAFPATIMLTGAGSEEVAVRALKSGVYDYLRKEKLNKDQVIAAIEEAFARHQTEKQRLIELTSHSRAFNKALFYQQLEQHQKEPGEHARVLMLITLDKHQLIEERAGLILRDNIVRHIARQSYEVFQLGECNPNITRFSDIAIALLIDDPDDNKTLQFNLEGLCKHLQNRPYKYEDKKFRFTVSIGVVRLQDFKGTPDAAMRTAGEGCQQALNTDGNSFHIVLPRPKPPQPKPAAAKPEPPPPKARPEPEPKPAPPKARPEPEPKPAPPKARPEPEPKPAPPKARPAPEPKPAPPKARPEPEPTPAAPEAKPAAESKPDSPDARSGQTQATAKPKPAQDQAQPAESGLSEKALQIKKAFDEKRVIQTFQSIISMGGDDDESSDSSDSSDVYFVSLQMMGKDGSILGAEDILQETDSPPFRKYIDRWMLREAIGRVVNNPSEDYLFVLRLSKDSLADASLFTWLRDLLSGFDAKRPGESIALEISAEDFTALQKPAGALMTYLDNNHGFKFVLGEVGSEHNIAALCQASTFNLVRVHHERLSTLSDTQEGGDSAVSVLNQKGIGFIADQIADSMALTLAIGAGADYAMGGFIGEPLQQLDGQTNIESLEIV